MKGGIFLFADPHDQLMSLTLIIYKFDGVPQHPVLVRPHGNAKSNKPYRRTKESTKSLLRDKLHHGDPKDAIDKVLSKKGGVQVISPGTGPRHTICTESLNSRKS